MVAEEKRRDPSDGGVYTWEEIEEYYAGKYKKKALAAYWENECEIVKGKKSKGKEVAATPKAKAKVKAKAKAGRKAKEEDDDSPTVKMEDIEAKGLCVAGEALIDFLPTKTADGESAFKGKYGGSPFNCCIAAHRLGIPTTYLGALSTDLFGEELHAHLQKEGVNLDLVSRVDNPTTLAFVMRSAGEGEKYAFFKENAADRSLTKEYVSKVLRGKRFEGIHMSLGAVTLEASSCAEAFATLFKIGQKMGALRSFDPNLRSNMISEGAKAYSKKIEGMLRLIDLVKTSEEDVQFLYGEDVSLETVAAKWMKLGPKLVVITKGSKGAEVYVPQRNAEGKPTDPLVLQVPVPTTPPNTIDATGKAVPVVDSVGAGDTFMGGLVMGILDGEKPLLQQLVKKKDWDDAAVATLQDVLNRAAVAAAIVCSRAGADPPTRAEVETASKK